MASRKAWSKVNHTIGYIFYSFIFAYFIWSIVNIARVANKSYLGADKLYPGGVVLNILALFLEILGFIFALYFAIQLIDGVLKVGEREYDITKISGKTKVSVIVPIHNVQSTVLSETLEGFTKQSYKNFDLWVADDSTDEILRKNAEETCKKYGFTYFYEDNKNFKSGMLNLVIPKTDGDLIAFFDVDHVPEPDILSKFVAILEQYPEFSYIQARFGFRNVTNLLHVWEAMSLMQTFCSENARRELGTVLYSGSSAIFRRECAYPIPEGQMTEDFDHSIKLILEGKKGYFLDEIGSMSLVPETIAHQITQLFRWFTGQSGALFDHGTGLIKGVIKKKISFKQALDILFSSTLVLAATSFYPLAVLYSILYFGKIPLVRAWFLGQFSNIYYIFYNNVSNNSVLHEISKVSFKTLACSFLFNIW
ncbi:MAG: glycosyltransferase [Candidatus Heimdallarchaeaceae archaeon]